MNTNNGAKIKENPATTMFALLIESPSLSGFDVDGVDGVSVDGGDELLPPVGVVVVGELEV